LAGRDDRFPAVAGAVAVKVFDCNAAAVGLTFRQAAKRYQDVRTVCVSAQDRPHYWPETKDIALQIVYRSGSRQVLGVQVVGEGDVTKRVDVATQLIREGATVDHLAQLEHAYAPPFSPALDPLAVLAFAAQNAEDGVEASSPITSLGDIKLLDVRHEEEREARPLSDSSATPIPLAEVRQRVGELEGGPWLVVCERGMRSAETVRVLNAKGIAAQYLGGGMKWLIFSGKAESKEK
jgi:rhodanese-related sulfurtransferase